MIVHRVELRPPAPGETYLVDVGLDCISPIEATHEHQHDRVVVAPLDGRWTNGTIEVTATALVEVQWWVDGASHRAMMTEADFLSGFRRVP